MAMRTKPRQPLPPLDAAALDRLALRYVERFATTRAKLARYLAGKVRQRGWDGPPADPVAVAERMAQLGYVDDTAFAEARGRALTRRGYGEGRVRGALRHAGIASDSIDTVARELEPEALAAALALARRRRIGPFASAPADRATLAKHIATLVRGGHDFALARRIALLPPGADLSDFDQG